MRAKLRARLKEIRYSDNPGRPIAAPAPSVTITLPSHGPVRACVCVCVVFVCGVCACACACVHVCVCLCVDLRGSFCVCVLFQTRVRCLVLPRLYGPGIGVVNVILQVFPLLVIPDAQNLHPSVLECVTQVSRSSFCIRVSPRSRCFYVAANANRGV